MWYLTLHRWVGDREQAITDGLRGPGHPRWSCQSTGPRASATERAAGIPAGG